MLEKNSAVVLTSDDLDMYNRGLVSERVQELWSLSLEQLREIVENNNFTQV